MASSRAVLDVLAHATGRAHRPDPELPGSGGPAGNAQLTAWLGLLLLALSLAELLSLVSVRHLLTWHIVVGVLLIPPALVKIATTGWRMARYYTRSAAYQLAGPPPLLLRLLGPLVVVSTVAVLASGVVLVALGPTDTFRPLFTVAGRDVNWLTLHQGSFIAWGIATGLHVLGRLVPSLRLARAPRGSRRDGLWLRVVVMAATVLSAALLAYLVVGWSDAWTSGFQPEFRIGDEGG